MSFPDLLIVSDYAKLHGILPVQAASMLSQLGMIGQVQEATAITRRHEGTIGALEVVL